MTNFDAFLSRLAFILLLIWAVWFSTKLGVTPEEVGQAIKTFNSSFGPGLPPPADKSVSPPK